jgi:predicted alpha/beta hydrolase
MLTTPAAPRKTVAVLICQSYGIEYMRSHRALYLLAERLADAGFYVMRFDYFATGDSAGDSGHARIDHWLDNISDASQELRRRTGLRELCLIGHRLGALLAAASLKRSSPGDMRLLMVDPPDDGASWLAQQERLQFESHLWRNAQRPRSTKLPRPSGLDLFGHPVGEAWREQLIALSYKDVSPMGVALSADEHFDSVVTPVRMPDPGHWDSLDWITRPWNPRSAVALLAAHLEQHVS